MIEKTELSNLWEDHPIEQIRSLVRRLSNPEIGCSWEKKQTIDSLSPYLIEETYEVVDAILKKDMLALKEELGDLIFLLMFECHLQEENQSFGFYDVCLSLLEKMKRRHPHIFSTNLNPNSSKLSWEEIKQQERTSLDSVKERSSLFQGQASALPSLLSSQRIGEKVANVGFDWPKLDGVRQKLQEELGELDAAIAEGSIKEIIHELGDVLFVLARLASKLNFSAEMALREANNRFIRRFSLLEHFAKQEGKFLKQLSLEEMNCLWQKAKLEEANP